jgi:hypothetical protein
MLASNDDIPTCYKAFIEGYAQNQDIKLYEFDTCIAEYCG